MPPLCRYNICLGGEKSLLGRRLFALIICELCEKVCCRLYMVLLAGAEWVEKIS